MYHPQRTAGSKRTTGILFGAVAVLALVVLALFSQAPAVGAAPTPYVASTGEGSTLLPDGRLLFTGGILNNLPSNSVALFDPRTGQRQTLSTKLRHARSSHSATLLPDGRVLVLGLVQPCNISGTVNVMASLSGT